MLNHYPGFVGNKIIPNPELQTGVHCGDIAIHIESLRSDPKVQSAIAFLQANNNKTLYATDKQTSVIKYYQQVLVDAVKQKRLEICVFAIQQVNDKVNEQQSEHSIECCKLLAQEIQGAILTEEPEITFILQQWKEIARSGTITLEDFCNNPDICIQYINEYYLNGDHMFKKPPAGGSGMMDIVAMQLKRKIIVIDATNGAPYESKYPILNENSSTPIYVGYDGHLHFVELVPLTLEELAEISDDQADTPEMPVIECLLAIRLAEATQQATEQQLLAASDLLAEAKVLYTNTASMQQSFSEVFFDFVRLLVKSPHITQLEDAFQTNNEAQILAENPELEIELRTATELHLLLLEKQVQWLEPRQNLEQIPDLDKHLQYKLLAIELHNHLNKVEPFDVEYLKQVNNIINIIKIQASRILVMNKNHEATYAKLNEIRSIFTNILPEPVINAPMPQPQITPVAAYTPSPTISLSFIDKVKNLFDKILKQILYQLNWLLSVFTDSTTPTYGARENSPLNYQAYFTNSADDDAVVRAITNLAEMLKKHFEKKLSTTRDRTAVIAEWHSIMQPLLRKEYVQFCVEVDNYMQRNTKEQQSQPYVQQTSSATAILPLHNRPRTKDDQAMEIKQRVKEISFKYNF